MCHQGVHEPSPAYSDLVHVYNVGLIYYMYVQKCMHMFCKTLIKLKIS